MIPIEYLEKYVRSVPHRARKACRQRTSAERSRRKDGWMPRGRRIERGPAIVTGRGAAAGLEHDLALEEGEGGGGQRRAGYRDKYARIVRVHVVARALVCVPHKRIYRCRVHGQRRWERDGGIHTRAHTYVHAHAHVGRW